MVRLFHRELVLIATIISVVYHKVYYRIGIDQILAPVFVQSKIRSLRGWKGLARARESHHSY